MWLSDGTPTCATTGVHIPSWKSIAVAGISVLYGVCARNGELPSCYHHAPRPYTHMKENASCFCEAIMCVCGIWRCAFIIPGARASSRKPTAD